MASVQERLQLKRMPLENWSISEQLYLASAVACSGDQNWMSVSRQLRLVCGNNRPSDWFSQKSCAAQYEMLLENVEPTKRKKRNEKDTSQATVETPIELIVRKLTLERIGELQKLIQEEREEYHKKRNEIANIQNNVYDEHQLRDMMHQIESEEKQREREKQKYAQWLKEREERKKNELERQARTNPHQSPSTTFHSSSSSSSSPLTQHLNQKIKVEEMEVDEVNNALNTKQGTSPLLTSLLKSPSAAPNPSPSMLHNLSSQARVTAPTITNLLTGSVSNLSNSLANVNAVAVAITGANKSTIASSGTPITTHTVYTSQHTLHNHPLTGPPSNHDQIIGSIAQSPSQAAPTLSMLLENKQKEMVKMPPLSRIESQNTAVCTSMEQQPGADTTKTEPTDTDFNNAESPIKDEDQNLLEVFNELIPDDIGELADIILDDLINEEQVAAVSQAAENLDGQINLDLKNFQSQSAQHTTQSAQIKVEPIRLNENNCDSTVSTAPKIQDPFDALKEQKDPMPLNNMKNEKKIILDLPKHEDGDDGDDDDSDLSNDTPLSELIKQEASAKQQRSQASTPKDISSTTEQPADIQTVESNEPKQIDQPEQIGHDGDEQSALDNKVDDSSDLLENRISKHENYVESTQKDHANDFNIGKLPVVCDEKPTKIEISMPIDSFESDSNDEKSMENIKREIEALPELKDSNSSENSQDEKIGMHNTMAFRENVNAESTEPGSDKLNDNSVGGGDQTFDKKFDTETIDLVDTENEAENEFEPADLPDQPVTVAAEKDEQVKSSELNESIDLTESKNDIIGEHNESTAEDNEMTCDKVEATEKSEPIESEKIEIMDTDESQGENGEAFQTDVQEVHEEQQAEQKEQQEQLQQHQQEEQKQQQQLHNEEEESQQQQQQQQSQLDEREKEAKEEEELKQQQQQQQDKHDEEEEEEEEQQSVDSTAAETVLEISSDEMQDKDDEQPTKIDETKDEIKAEADDTDDCIEIKSDDQKPDEPSSPLPPPPHEEKSEKIEENAETSVKKESDDQMPVDGKPKSPTPKPAVRKVSSDDELFEDAKETLEVDVKPPPPKRITPAITTCDTDDDSVIEVVKEEKVGVKRDYSRRKKDQSHSEKHNRTADEQPPAINDDGGSISSRLRIKERDRSESPFIEEDSGEPLPKNKRRYSTTPVIDSPNSPASSDDRDYRSWKKSILLLYSSLAGHRCASIFAKPITDEQAPNYSELILQPMDLQSLKRNIDSGQIRNIFDFQLYVMRMCYNAIFYNINDDVICARAKEMLNDALQQIAEFSVTWKKESEKASSVSSTSSNVTKSVRGRKSNRLMN